MCDLDVGEETLGSLLTGHRALLLVFSDIACPACDALFPRLAAWQRAGGLPRVVLVRAGRVPAGVRLPEGVSALVDVDGIVARSYGVRSGYVGGSAFENDLLKGTHQPRRKQLAARAKVLLDLCDDRSGVVTLGRDGANGEGTRTVYIAALHEPPTRGSTVRPA